MIGFHPTNFGLPGPFRSRVRSRHATDRQTDRQTDTAHHFIIPPPYRGQGKTTARGRHKKHLIMLHNSSPLEMQSRLLLLNAVLLHYRRSFHNIRFLQCIYKFLEHSLRLCFPFVLRNNEKNEYPDKRRRYSQVN